MGSRDPGLVCLLLSRCLSLLPSSSLGQGATHSPSAPTAPRVSDPATPLGTGRPLVCHLDQNRSPRISPQFLLSSLGLRMVPEATTPGGTWTLASLSPSCLLSHQAPSIFSACIAPSPPYPTTGSCLWLMQGLPSAPWLHLPFQPSLPWRPLVLGIKTPNFTGPSSPAGAPSPSPHSVPRPCPGLEASLAALHLLSCALSHRPLHMLFPVPGITFLLLSAGAPPLLLQVPSAPRAPQGIILSHPLPTHRSRPGIVRLNKQAKPLVKEWDAGCAPTMCQALCALGSSHPYLI